MCKHGPPGSPGCHLCPRTKKPGLMKSYARPLTLLFRFGLSRRAETRIAKVKAMIRKLRMIHNQMIILDALLTEIRTDS
jgi:hypothetical protein